MSILSHVLICVCKTVRQYMSMFDNVHVRNIHMNIKLSSNTPLYTSTFKGKIQITIYIAGKQKQVLAVIRL